MTTSAINAFGPLCIGVQGGPASFSIAGTNLPAGNVSIGALNGFGFSISANGPFTTSLTIAQPGGSFNQTIYVQFTATATVSYDGTSVISIGGNSTTLALSGSGVNTVATMLTESASGITTHSAQLAGNISNSGCSNISDYGIEYSTTADFVPGTGIRIPAASNILGNYSVELSSLIPGTRYYYRSYGINNGGTAFGDQLSFLTSPIPDALTIYDNPVAVSGNFHFSINSIQPGTYAFHIYNNIGQVVVKKEYTVTGTFIDDHFTLPNYLSPGVYSLRLQNSQTGFKQKKSFVIK